MDAERLRRAEAILGHDFKDRSLLVTALTHPSFVPEHPGSTSYDRLEFLGDAVLGLVVAEHLFRLLPDTPEGGLTERKAALVNGALLAEVADRHSIGDLVAFGKGERGRAQGRSRSLENTLEALIGAVYIDGGLQDATDTVRRLFGTLLDRSDLAPPEHPKSALAARTQGLRMGTPHYRTLSTEGPPHERWFTAEVLVGDRRLAVGEGRSKQAAEKAAAAAALAAMDAESASDADASEPETLW